uniref:Large ribosomal subunit protein uL29m n=1 Tax=Timema bartmani TaxID=61472 RepID=A0A7R9EUR8_9NEOP|nr:unnamed protein product [Timema bartmani]
MFRALIPLSAHREIHLSHSNRDLMDFFDDKKNWNANEVKVGRSWKLEELRIKSNGDLHKLWFVLLKEKNMLLTMEHTCKEKVRLFPNPERIDKVEESMENLEQVVRERNRAYFQLETGETGERPGKPSVNAFGLNYFHKMSEHLIPKWMNTAWKKKFVFNKPDPYVKTFLSLYREKLWSLKRKEANRQRSHVMHLLKRFPNLDKVALREQYPQVDLEKALQQGKSRGHHGQNTA